MRTFIIQGLSVLLLLLAVGWWVLGEGGWEAVITAVAALVGLFSAEFIKGEKAKSRVHPVQQRFRHEDGGPDSIIVLPFDNLSPDPRDAYFSDGLTEEIITNLSHIHSLRVISRNSAMALKGTQKDTRTISEELDVKYVLEGSVRKAGDDLRITAQLIDGPSDTHLWAEKYDGELKDVFGMQEKVSRAIADALKVTLDPSEEARVSVRPVDDLVAFECYLKARHQMWLMTEESLKEALDLLARGIALQPDSAHLHATRAYVSIQYPNTMNPAPVPYAELLEEAKGWAARAIQLDPDSSMAHFSHGTVDWFRGILLSSMTHLVRAIRLNPNHADALNFLGFNFLIGGHHQEEAREFLARAAHLDPLNPLNSEVSRSYFAWFSGDFAGVIESWKTWRELEAPLPRLYTGYFHAAAGKLEKAIQYWGKISQDTPAHPAASAGAFFGYALQGEPDKALASVTEKLEESAWWDEFTPILLADAYALIGEDERAIHWVNRAIDMGMCNVDFLGEHEPFLRELHGKPGFEVLLEKAERVTHELAVHADSLLKS
jgi:TolB-like protein